MDASVIASAMQSCNMSFFTDDVVDVLTKIAPTDEVSVILDISVLCQLAAYFDRRLQVTTICFLGNCVNQIVRRPERWFG